MFTKFKTGFSWDNQDKKDSQLQRWSVSQAFSPYHVRLCNPIKCITPGFPILHYLTEFAETHVHWVSDATQPSHPFVLSSVFPASGPFPVSQFFTSGGWSIGASASVTVLPMNFQDWFPIGLTGLILLLKGLLSLLRHLSAKVLTLRCSAFFMVQLSHPYTITGKNIALTMSPLSVKWCLCFLIRCLGLS